MTDLILAGGQAALLVAGFAALAASLHWRDLVRAVAAFAGGSAFVAGAFFVLAAPFAGALELTVGGGLMAVLFLVTITLTDDPRGTKEGAP